MRSVPRRKAIVLAVHPWSGGIGWVAFEGPTATVDWGITEARGDHKNARCLTKFERLLDRYNPAVVVLETFQGKVAPRAARIQRLCRAFLHLAHARGAETPIYSRAAIRTCFSSIGVVTRYEIVQAVVQHIAEFRRYMPRRRKRWESEDGRLSLFEAAALAITHYAIAGDADSPRSV